MSLDEHKCEQHFKEHVKRTAEGRFIVKLPVKQEKMSLLGYSKDIAIQRFKSLERRLDRDSTLKRAYTDFIEEYKALGHMRELVNTNKDLMPHYYLPHHCVVKKESSTKLRVVFDASCKTSTGISLNDALLVGPVLQQDLFSIVVRFRTFKYALVADVAKMYRQVLVDESQVSLQRIIWRNNQNDDLQEFELLTLTYGTAPASFLAIRSIRALAEIEAKNYPLWSRIVLRDFYVDDLITGANSIAEALKIRDESNRLLSKGGFLLRKWTTNNLELLEGLPAASTATSTRALDKEEVFKTLGIQWNPAEDIFQYKVSMSATSSRRVTKRAVLFCIAQIFDPLGLIGPVVTRAKLFIQKLWILHLDWDESLPIDLHTEWNIYRSHMTKLNAIRIPRWAMPADTAVKIELHGFSDASQNAYGACVYTRITDQNGTHHTRVLCSKSRVAPLKAISVPRLELCGAQLLAQLMVKIVQALDSEAHDVYHWTDSTIVLDWIRSPSRRFNAFVSNRIGEIQELTTIQSWHHISTEDNPADILSRGAGPDVLEDEALWWNGPKWLREDKSSWPNKLRPIREADELPEHRKVLAAAAVVSNNFGVIERFSSYVRLVRAIAICLRFIHNSRSNMVQRRFGPISSQEIEAARKAIVKRVQHEVFQEEIEGIKDKTNMRKGSRLIGLNPYLDHEGLVRVGGRLKNSELAYEAKHPLIIPANNHFSRLIIEYEHKKSLHAGSQATLSVVRARYWPLGGRRMVRSVVHGCVTCFKARPRASQSIMGDLPAYRVVPSRPFYKTGIDYCGPIFVREGRRRNAKKSKAWIAIFVCCATKAIHIELVSDLSTEGFLGALRRFIGRRRRPSDIFSDNGTNFVGAARELEELRELFNSEEFRRRVTNETAEDAIAWHFIPSRAPHFGGLWESAVRVAKQHLNRVTSDGSLTFEQAATLLIQIEAILNSRLLTPVSMDVEDYSFITPGHFLIGDSLTSYPEPDLQHLPINRLSQWQQIELRRQQFWKRWSLEYLHQLQQRTKWKKNEGPPLQIGQMVILREGSMPPLSWIIGRITEVHPGADDVIRVASVKTPNPLYIPIFKRAATKLCMLPINN